MTSPKSRKLSPDTLTQRWLEMLGWTVDQCQRKTGNITRDLFGFADQCAFACYYHLLVQTTTTSNLADRRRKVLEHPNAVKWKRARTHNRIFLVAWRDLTGKEPPVLEEVQWVRQKLIAVRDENAIARADVRHLV